MVSINWQSTNVTRKCYDIEIIFCFIVIMILFFDFEFQPDAKRRDWLSSHSARGSHGALPGIKPTVISPRLSLRTSEFIFFRTASKQEKICKVPRGRFTERMRSGSRRRWTLSARCQTASTASKTTHPTISSIPKLHAVHDPRNNCCYTLHTRSAQALATVQAAASSKHAPIALRSEKGCA